MTGTILTLVGWLIVAMMYFYWLVAFGQLFLDCIGKYNFSGGRNSIVTRFTMILIAVFNIFLGVKLAQIAPFTLNF